MKRVAAYCRISTSTQDTSSQLLAIKEAIQSNGDTLISVYEDLGISGVKSRSDRPALDQMLRDAKAGKFDKVVCFDISTWAVDGKSNFNPARFGTSRS